MTKNASNAVSNRMPKFPEKAAMLIYTFPKASWWFVWRFAALGPRISGANSRLYFPIAQDTVLYFRLNISRAPPGLTRSSRSQIHSFSLHFSLPRPVCSYHQPGSFVLGARFVNRESSRAAQPMHVQSSHHTSYASRSIEYCAYDASEPKEAF